MFNKPLFFHIPTWLNRIDFVERGGMILLLIGLMSLMFQPALAEPLNPLKPRNSLETNKTGSNWASGSDVCNPDATAGCRCIDNTGWKIWDGIKYSCKCVVNKISKNLIEFNIGASLTLNHWLDIDINKFANDAAKTACWMHKAYEELPKFGLSFKEYSLIYIDNYIGNKNSRTYCSPKIMEIQAVGGLSSVIGSLTKYLITHEMFHAAQCTAKIEGKQQLMITNQTGKVKWIIEGTAKWFEDAVYDDENPYEKRGEADKKNPIPEILSVGLDVFTEDKDAYRRFAFWKLILGNCPGIRNDLANIFNVSDLKDVSGLEVDPTGIKNLEFIMAKTEATKDCQDLDWECFGRKITDCVTQCGSDTNCIDKCYKSLNCPPGPDDPNHYRSSFDKFNQEYHLLSFFNLLQTAMQVYQVATVIKNDMSILDSNEKKDGGYFVDYNNSKFNGLLNIKGDISQIKFGTISNEYSGNIPPYSAKTIVVNRISGDISKSNRKPYLSANLSLGIMEKDHILWNGDVLTNISDINHKEHMWGRASGLILPNPIVSDPNRFWWAYDKCLTDSNQTSARYMTIVNTDQKNKLSAEIFAGIAPKSYFSMSIGGNEKISCISSYRGGSEYLLNPANPNYFDAINLYTAIYIGYDESRLAEFQLGFMNPVNFNNGPHIISSAGGFYVHKKGNQEVESFYLSTCPGTYGTLNIQSVQPYSLPKSGCESGKLVTGTFSFDGCRWNSTTAVKVAGNLSAVADSNCGIDYR